MSLGTFKKFVLTLGNKSISTLRCFSVLGISWQERAGHGPNFTITGTLTYTLAKKGQTDI